MDTNPALMLGCITFIYVFSKAYQQRNVIHNGWLAVPIFSYLMAFLELAGLSIGIIDIANNGWGRLLVLGLAHGTGGTIGCWAAMWLHNRIGKAKL